MIARTMLATLAVAGATAAALPGVANAKADASQSCTVIASRDKGSGPPPRYALITVVNANGNLRTEHSVPGPCTAPGFTKGYPGS